MAAQPSAAITASAKSRCAPASPILMLRWHPTHHGNYLGLNAILIEAATQALERITEWDSPAAGAIREHLDALVGYHRRILAEPAAEINPEDDLNHLLVTTWRRTGASK